MKLFKPYTTKSGTHHPFKPSMHGTTSFQFSAMVKNGIEVHGLKWAVNYYVVAHGLSAKEFRIFAAI